jgi:hypothetical protein
MLALRGVGRVELLHRVDRPTADADVGYTGRLCRDGSRDRSQDQVRISWVSSGYGWPT